MGRYYLFTECFILNGYQWFTTTLITLSKTQNISNHLQIDDLRGYRY